MSKKLLYFVSFILVPSLAVSAQASLVGHWEFDEGSGSTAFDSSGNGFDGTISGAEWVAGGWDGTGYCLDFDGQGSDRVSVGSFNVTGEAISIACWFKADNLDTPGNDPRMVSKAIGGSNEQHWFMVSSSRQGSIKVLRFRLKTDGSTGELKADTATGLIGDPCVRATATMTLALPKVGLEFAPTVVGELYLADISVPGSVYQAFGIELVDPFDEGSVVSITA